MNQPSFKNYINTLASLLKHKGAWLLKESQDLARLCQEYGKQLRLTHQERKILLMAAYIKNLGALYVSNDLLEQEFRDHTDMMLRLQPWFLESSIIAREAGLEDVAIVLDQYHQRSIPEHKLARIFQVLNTWIACQQEKGWRHPMTRREAQIILEQRAHLRWSDPILVRHFIHHLNYVNYLDQAAQKTAV
jgi:response regulator RpfG family c-di-GMP phosphodiesterase